VAENNPPNLVTDTPRLRLFHDDAEAVDALFQEALHATGPSAFVEFVDFVDRFNRLSVFNALLVRVQRPGATAVGSRYQWRRIGRSVTPDAVPIVILQPFGPVEFTYDLQDTSGDPIPGGDYDPFFVAGRVPVSEWDRTLRAATKCSVTVELTANYGGALAGTAAHILPEGRDARTDFSGPNGRWRIRVNSRLSIEARFATLAHELGHIYCGHLGKGTKDQWPDRRGCLTESQEEIEAEAVAWVVCRRARITTNSAEYLRPHLTVDALSKISMFAILAAAHRVEARSEKEQKKSTPQSSLVESKE
jgi:hypothetical protein